LNSVPASIPEVIGKVSMNAATRSNRELDDESGARFFGACFFAGVRDFGFAPGPLRPTGN